MRAQLRRLLHWCGKNFALTILDAPPVLGVTDPAIVGLSTVATTLVVRHDVTTLGEVEAS